VVVKSVEIIKRDPEEFGGLQFKFLDAHELAWRMCCRRGCSYPARVQLTQPRILSSEPASYRTLCAKHFVQLVLITNAFLGDPSPATEANAMADFLGVSGDWRRAAVPGFHPEGSRCVECGGTFVAETTGMFSGKRYVHTCGVPKGIS
jgi:hypothetical protein